MENAKRIVAMTVIADICLRAVTILYSFQYFFSAFLALYTIEGGASPLKTSSIGALRVKKDGGYFPGDDSSYFFIFVRA